MPIPPAFSSPLFRVLTSFSLSVCCDAEVFTLSGDFVPDAAVTEGSNALSNVDSLTTRRGGATSWIAEDGFIKMTTAPNSEIWFGTSDLGYGDNSAVSLSDNLVGNRIAVSFRLTPGSQSWGFYFFDQEGYSAYMQVDQTDNGNAQDGLWVSGDSGAFKVSDASFDPTIVHTYEAHLQGGSVAYFLDGEAISTGLSQRTGNTSVYGLTVIGDGSQVTPTGTGSMWIDSLTINNAAGPYIIQTIPEPAFVSLLVGVLASVFGMRRRR